ncbi:phosphoribosylanthranilate isomerase [Deinococcus yavapaiensis]|uniref:N-(5'-phosphoribosyl)anthranilate isomerase n=1 Tax=Deinococcus yavapaiensis KR-236 TaxID=694435 RepID=A0A318SBU7_9DEIO|nr:phosphoribosylanthranilate isomerase [Deinococcus yavapaiensis]PYE48392.1 phosphoribosylanthranilate isomerase [Deinococcus yavapaiensis KR-236]
MSRTRVKICGTTSAEDALLAQDAGADAIGLIFASISKRRVDVAAARRISLALDPSFGRIGVFLDASLDEVLRTAHEARLSAVQVHGEVGDAFLDVLLNFWPVLRALRPGDEIPTPRTGLSLLFDAAKPGGGVPFDWRSVPFPAGAWLAGGLSPENVCEAMTLLRPFGVDAVSSLERGPGRKDPARVRAFVEQSRRFDGERFLSS